MAATNGYSEPAEGASESQKSENKELKKLDYKALFLIQQCVDDSNYEKIAGAKTTKEAWDKLEKCYEGVERVKKVRLQTLRRQVELLAMGNSEVISESFTRILLGNEFHLASQ